MKRLATLLSLIALISLASCAAGPQQLTRSVDDWDQEFYVDSPRLDGLLYIIPVIPIMKYGAAIGDFLIVNPYHFWGEDVWDDQGTNFKHMEVETADGYVSSLWDDDAKFLFKAE
jgi:hypothetical protein